MIADKHVMKYKLQYHYSNYVSNSTCVFPCHITILQPCISNGNILWHVAAYSVSILHVSPRRIKLNLALYNIKCCLSVTSNNELIG